RTRGREGGKVVLREITGTHATALPSRLGSVALEILRRNSVTAAITPGSGWRRCTIKTDRTWNCRSVCMSYASKINRKSKS
ncbi:hypothetical protein X777_16821, partial [Ooceraea biroi]